MRLKLSLVSGQQRDDVVITVDATATVEALAERLRVSHPSVRIPVQPGARPTLRVQTAGSPDRVIDPSLSMSDSGIRSGDFIALSSDTGRADGSRTAAASMRVQTGPDAGKVFPLAVGTTLVGRDRSCEIRLNDPQVSKRHLRVNVSDYIEIIDENSANGTQLGNETVQRAIVRSTDVVRLGDTDFSIALEIAQAASGTAGKSSHALEFNRSPRLDPQYEGIELLAPEPPQRPAQQRFPIIPLIAPIFMAMIMYAVTKNVLSILFMALSPIMLGGTFFETRMANKRAFTQGSADFRGSLKDLVVQMQYAIDIERTQRRREHPAVAEVAEAVAGLTPLMWTRRPSHASFLELRLGLGTQRSRNIVKLPTTNNTTAEIWRELQAVAGDVSTVDRVPIVASFRQCGGVGVAGPSVSSHPLAAGLIAQLVGLHSPAEVVLAAVTSSTSAKRWEWLKWLPHVGSDHSPLMCDHLAASAGSATALISELEDLLAARSTDRYDEGVLPNPVVVLLVEDDAAAERARLVHIATDGPPNGIMVVWVAPSVERIPAACRVYLEVDPNTGEGRAGFVDSGTSIGSLELEPLAAEQCLALGRKLSPAIDSGALLEDQSDLPRSVSFLALGGLELAESSSDIAERWRGSNSLPPEANAPRLKRDNNLKALVGQSASDRFYLDLRTNGPHALVGGTTGAGKSEFLQSWIIGMAAAHSPTRVNFLFVDYKGGAAFADCVHLPHNVGLVTDLSPHLVRRALRSLNAELRRREHILNAKKAKDLLELERRRDPDAPPSLVIVVDEFAALVKEVPEFVDGVVNVAQRGRSLGLHLILATQRPAGVIKDNLRANTNLRVALRMADEADSEDVIGTTQAAGFDPATPGRGIAKTGPGRLSAFQAAYIGGYTSNTPSPPIIDINEFPYGVGTVWDAVLENVAVEERPQGPNDIQRVVTNISAAAVALNLPPVRLPWMPELGPLYRLENLPSPRTDRELVFGVIDQPDEQAQPVVSFRPDEHGNMAVYGTGGSGKSAFLRSIAVAAGFAPARGGPCTVYALDFGSRGLAMLEDLPHVGAVIYADDNERVVRLIRQLRAMIDDRAERYGKANAGSLDDYRTRAGQPNEQRVIVLVDNFAAFRQAYEMGSQSAWFEIFQSIATDGRVVGVHVVLSADRPGSVPSSLSATIQRRLVLRLSNEMDYTMLNTPSDVFTAASPPGRGFMDGCDVQIAVLGGDTNVANQAAEMVRFGRSIVRAGVAPVTKMASLSDRVLPAELPANVGGQPVLGIWDETLLPIGFETTGVFAVTGPPQSGKTNTVSWLVKSLTRHNPATQFALFGTRRSTLVNSVSWTYKAQTPEDMERLATDLAEKVSGEDPSVASLVVVVESIGELLNGPADTPLQDLFRACRAMDRFVIAEGETTSIGSSWPLLQAAKASRYGMAMQPTQADGDSVFKTSFPRTTRAEFPQGRGLFVRSGRVARVQIPLVS
jgi:DNA segregation ATPase FtsK/SpoIIIE, S-DNA-T family